MPFMLLPWSSRKTRSPTHISGCILTSTPCGPVLIIYIYTPPPLPKLKELLNVEERKFRGVSPSLPNSVVCFGQVHGLCVDSQAFVARQFSVSPRAAGYFP